MILYQHIYLAKIINCSVTEIVLQNKIIIKISLHFTSKKNSTLSATNYAVLQTFYFPPQEKRKPSSPSEGKTTMRGFQTKMVWRFDSPVVICQGRSRWASLHRPHTSHRKWFICIQDRSWAPFLNYLWVISSITSNQTAAVSSTVNKSNYSRCDGWKE